MCLFESNFIDYLKHYLKNYTQNYQCANRILACETPLNTMLLKLASLSLVYGLEQTSTSIFTGFHLLWFRC